MKRYKSKFEENLLMGLEKYPEYKPVVDSIMKDIGKVFNKHSKEIYSVQKTSDMYYGQQFVLEEIIRKLEANV